MLTHSTPELKSHTSFTPEGKPFKVEYYHLDVFDEKGKFINFGIIHTSPGCSPTQEQIDAQLRRVEEWRNTPASVLESMHSPRD